MDKQRIQKVLQDKPELAAKGAEALQSVLSRSATDSGYRQRLLTDPRTAISEVTGRPLPSDYTVAFIENNADTTIVLPPVATLAPVELNEAELQGVAGGCTPVSGVVASVLSVISSVTWAVSEYENYKHQSDSTCNS
jgi:hypothetical protein